MSDVESAGVDGRDGDHDDADPGSDSTSSAGPGPGSDAGGRIPPGPDGLPFLGVAPWLVRDQLGFGQRMAEKYGDVGRAVVAGREFYGVNHPDYVERVLVTEHDSFVKGELTTSKMENLSPNSLLLAEGERWQAIREVLQPAFFMEQVVEYTDEMGEIAAEIAAGWDDGQRLDAEDVSRTLATRVLSRTLFGADVREREDTLHDAARAIRRRFDTNSPSVFLPDWVPTPRIWRYRKAVAALDDLVEELIRARRDSPEDYDDILAELVVRSRESDVMDHATLKDNAKGLLVAGHDTTASALSMTLGLLALHPDVQARVREEVQDVVGEGSDATPGAAAVRRLEYTDAVVRETLRLYPPAPALYRESVAPVDVGEYTIPTGVDVTVSPWVVHRDERWWDDPETFEPGRWLDDGDGLSDSDGSVDPGAERPEYAYFPFGGGPRHCLGMRFAMTELKLAVATFCRRVELGTPSTAMPDVNGGMTLSPESPIEVVVRRS